MKKVIAFDMGATSIRGILGYIEDGSLKMEEIMRFSHKIVSSGGRARWQWQEIMDKIADTVLAYKDEISAVAVDTWGVDFGILDKDGELIDTPISYRDERHEEGFMLALESLSKEEIFTSTGTQIMSINTLFQLLALRKTDKEAFDKIDKVLMLPDLINYMLCGYIGGEETIWSTSQILNLETRDYANDIIEKFGFDKDIFPTLNASGVKVGNLKNTKIAKLSGLDIDVISVCGHDTASAVMLTKAFTDMDTMFLSCGTWSLIGARVEKSDLSKKAFDADLTNELGASGASLFFKNLTGLYLLEKYKRELEAVRGTKIAFPEITEAMFASYAAKKEYESIIDIEDASFAREETSAKESIDTYLQQRNLVLPASDMEYFRLIYESMVAKYIEIKHLVEENTGRRYKKLHVIGGGARSEFLCRLISDKLGVNLIAGPFEASALGNIILQLVELGEISCIKEGLEIAYKANEVKEYSLK